MGNSTSTSVETTIVPATGDTVPATGDTVPATGDTVPATGDTVPATGDTVPAALETEREVFLVKIQKLTEQVQLLEARVKVLENEDSSDTDEIKGLRSHKCNGQFVVVSKNAEGVIELIGRTNVSLTPSGDTMVHSQFTSNRHFMISLFRDALANIKEWDNYTLQYYCNGNWVQTIYIENHVETDVYRLVHKVRGNVMYVIAPYTRTKMQKPKINYFPPHIAFLMT